MLNRIKKSIKQLGLLISRRAVRNNQKLDSHVPRVNDNQETIQYIEQCIKAILTKKTQIIHCYAEVSLNQSLATITGQIHPEYRSICDKLKENADSELRFYDKEFIALQKRRADLCLNHTPFFLDNAREEKNQSAALTSFYDYHWLLLEKIYLLCCSQANVNAANMPL
jgi:hypothetical protein